MSLHHDEWAWVAESPKRGRRHLVQVTGHGWWLNSAACGVGTHRGWKRGIDGNDRCKTCLRAWERIQGGRR